MFSLISGWLKKEKVKKRYFVPLLFYISLYKQGVTFKKVSFQSASYFLIDHFVLLYFFLKVIDICF